MADCECLSKCPFFNDKMANKPATTELMKRQYCKDEYQSCARFMVFRQFGREKVPAELFPNQVDRAREILAVG